MLKLNARSRKLSIFLDEWIKINEPVEFLLEDRDYQGIAHVIDQDIDEFILVGVHMSVQTDHNSLICSGCINSKKVQLCPSVRTSHGYSVCILRKNQIITHKE